MKAWVTYAGDDSNNAVFVYADKRSLAKCAGLWEFKQDKPFTRYIDIYAYRCKALDKYYKDGQIYLEWDNMDDRTALVKEYGIKCEEPETEDCEQCAARNYCSISAEAKKKDIN